MNYNKDTDYQEKINEAVKSGDYKSAAVYEKQRNEKIDGEKLPYEKTNNYSGWLDDTDYSAEIKNKIASGASRKSVSESLKDRITKASGTVGLSQYAYDDVYDEAIKYITGEGDYSYRFEERPPEYTSSYQSEIDKLYKKLLNMKEFSYDPEDDELYNYYKQEYNREGKRAMQDLLGVLSMNTGGVPSSYAVSAAGQVMEDYNAKLTDKIPDLYKAAYDRYLDSAESKLENLEMLADLEKEKYGRYLDKLKQYNADKEFDYRVYTDDLEKEEKKQKAESEYDNELFDRDYLMRKLFLEEEDLARKSAQQNYDNEQDKIETALKKWKEMGYLDAESARILGLPAGTHTVEYDYKKSR